MSHHLFRFLQQTDQNIPDWPDAHYEVQDKWIVQGFMRNSEHLDIDKNSGNRHTIHKLPETIPNDLQLCLSRHAAMMMSDVYFDKIKNLSITLLFHVKFIQPHSSCFNIDILEVIVHAPLLPFQQLALSDSIFIYSGTTQSMHLM